MTQAYVGDSGIVLGGTDDFGVRWTWQTADPFQPGPSPRAVTGDRANDHGQWDATKFYGNRVYALEGVAKAPDHETLHRTKERFSAAVTLNLFQLRVIEPAFDRYITVRRDNELLWTEQYPTIAKFSASLFAPDPRIYAYDLSTASTVLPSSVGGLTLPFTVPFQITATVNSGSFLARNDGTITAWPKYRIDGPVSDPAIINLSTGDAMRFAITLGDGEWMTVNTATHQVLLFDEPSGSRRSAFYGKWWGYEPNGNTTGFFAASGGTNATLSSAWRSTWL